MVSETLLAGFDRSILVHHTMEDAALAGEVLALFEAQLKRLEELDWAGLDLKFEMHTLRGAAAAVGALQLEALASQWQEAGLRLPKAFKKAAQTFRKAAS